MSTNHDGAAIEAHRRKCRPEQKYLEIKAACSVALGIKHKKRGEPLETMDHLARCLAACLSSDAMLLLCVIYDRTQQPGSERLDLEPFLSGIDQYQAQFREMWKAMGFTPGCPLVTTGENLRSQLDQETFKRSKLASVLRDGCDEENNPLPGRGFNHTEKSLWKALAPASWITL